MKRAISALDEGFEAVAARAKKLGISRSEFFGEASRTLAAVV